MPIPGSNLDTVDHFIGKELGVSDRVTIGQEGSTSSMPIGMVMPTASPKR
jgi:hypothetical protein